jgi:hypothetical protein
MAEKRIQGNAGLKAAKAAEAALTAYAKHDSYSLAEPGLPKEAVVIGHRRAIEGHMTTLANNGMPEYAEKLGAMAHSKVDEYERPGGDPFGTSKHTSDAITASTMKLGESPIVHVAPAIAPLDRARSNVRQIKP